MKNIKKLTTLALSLIIVSTSLVGCASSTAATTAAKATEATTAAAAAVTEATSAVVADTTAAAGYKVGISVYDLANPYFVTVVNGAQAKCDELGIELIVNDPKGDSAAQVAGIENFITVGVDAIIISALDVAACESSLQAAREKGIKIISQSSKSDTRDVYVSADEFDMGNVNGMGAGKWIADNYGEDAKIVCAILGNDKIATQIARGDGMEAGILKYAPNAVIVRQDANTTAEGQSVTDSLLQAHPDLQVICCLNDAGAIGAYSAVQAANKDTVEFYIGSIDATQQALDVIKTGGAFRATVDLIPYENGGIDVELAVQLIKGEEVPETYVVPAKLVTAADIK